MGSITLNKPSGGQLTISPEDGATNETVTIPSVGVGKVLQVVQSYGTDYTNITTSSWADVGGMSVSITPTSSTSKMLVFVEYHVYATNTDTGTWIGSIARIVRDDSTVLVGDPDDRYGDALYTASGNQRYMTKTGMNAYDTAGTTSPITYKLQGGALLGIYQGGAQFCRAAYGHGGSITVMEVAQ